MRTITTPRYAPQGCLYTLDPLLAVGPDALAPDLAAGILRVCLRELAIDWDNVFQERIIRRASDLFAAAAADGWYNLLPPGAQPVWAVLAFHLTGSSQSCLVEIRPPHTLLLSEQSAAPLLQPWFLAHGFELARN